MLNNPCNPTGAAYPRELLASIAQVALSHDLFVMSHFVDDTWATMTTTGVADLVDD